MWDVKCQECGEKEATINLQDVCMMYRGDDPPREMFHIGEFSDFFCEECYYEVKK